MGAVTYQQLKTNRKELQEIRTFHMVQEINEHITCCLTGVLAESFQNNIIQEKSAAKILEVYIDGEKPVTLFCGRIEEIEVSTEGGFHEIIIKGVSPSFQMDIIKKCRSFQEQSMTYHNLVRKIVAEYPGGDCMDNITKDKSLEQLIIQYNETDWEFLKRLASHFNMGIAASAQFAEPKIFFGTYEGLEKGEIKVSEYFVHKNIRKYKYLSENAKLNFSESDALWFEVKTTENYELGDQVLFQNHKLLIARKEICLTRSIVYFQYHLCNKKGMGRERIPHDLITGVSIHGTVLKVIKDKIKVHLDIDKEQDAAKAWLFPYGTLYTAEGQSGWYCMPEEGDTAAVYFPSSIEKDAVGTSCLRRGDTGTDKIDNPKMKYFRTADGKELKFSPDEIVITCINGKNPKTGETGAVYIKLNQDKGIEIMSTEHISLISDKGIKLEAEETIELAARKQIKLHCKQSEICMDSIIDISGPDVKIN